MNNEVEIKLILNYQTLFLEFTQKLRYSEVISWVITFYIFV